VARGPRGGRADGARDEPDDRGRHARRDRLRDDLPARAPDRGRPARPRCPAGGATIKVLRFENEAEQVLHYLYGAGIQPGLEGTVTQRDDEHVAFEDADGVAHALTISAAETVSVKADPSPPERVGLPAAVVLDQVAFGR
jgi:hypothetical protein